MTTFEFSTIIQSLDRIVFLLEELNKKTLKSNDHLFGIEKDISTVSRHMSNKIKDSYDT